MTNLERVEQRLQKTSTTSLAELVKARAVERHTFLLLDVSGSMADQIGPGHRKIDALRRIVDELRVDLRCPLVAFGLGTVEQVGYIEGQVPEPYGGTPLAEGIAFCRKEGATRIIVVSDGVPNSSRDAMQQAVSFGHPIDVFYVGSDHDPAGQDFLKSLSVAAGGHYDHTPLTAPKELASKIRGLLEA